MKLVILESPFKAGNGWTREENIQYARRCVRHSLLLEEAPIASHLLYTQEYILDDDDEKAREFGIEAGLAWKTVAEKAVYYMDHGFSSGMRHGMKACIKANLPIYARWLDGPVDLACLNGLDGFIDGVYSYAHN